MPERECPTCAATFLDHGRRVCPACGDVLPPIDVEEELPLVRGTVVPPPGLSEFLFLVGPPRPRVTAPAPIPRRPGPFEPDY